MKTTITHAKERLLGAYVDLKLAQHLLEMVSAQPFGPGSVDSKIMLDEYITSVESKAEDVRLLVDRCPTERSVDPG